MKEFDPVAYKQMVKKFQENDNPTGWFDSIYIDAQGDYKSVFWADLQPSPYLVKWLKENPASSKQKKAIVVGCGVGDDAQALSEYGYEVIGFDISKEAIKLCKSRYPNSKVTYLVADLFDYDKQWLENFDVVYECNTIQVLPGKYRIQARKAISNLVKKQGYALVSCRSRKKGEQENDIPLPLDYDEINKFVRDDNLEEINFLAYDDTQIPSVPHFFAIYKRNEE
ncbi:class I SAM-dependent methyltransferase [Poseidonibacter ostreae]|uniref:Methyltransferase domain-containing protein n=1 Tax=Poseidonibacter ostreae TaxID=2654171 RepID=A0A6L4WPP0_9BACT|nr:class I SAM-dependent methyltransferase [Poseidonibacter ostreae]KAB7881980.1 methyltransferase domain-containing protein [Poseidonibacter ostreae]KAB7886103.1 methyltransferase domain-containing protein [Poseidonibacter ostreae]KAB7889811.1 methyltransferase domain-containing protein [Poseidonibacter ostreae]MAC83907.1 methyltransferase type 11 [Arcobacter sp.]|tara:strand:- start:5417 stop:6091 length:675 start_codon:yes stop_codon:yes gene_type:complete